FPGTDQFGYNFPAHAVHPSLLRIRFPFARTMAYTGAAADQQDNHRDQQISEFYQGIKLTSACFHVAML
ncbi:MAG: hypothetical protein KJ649_10835, partial [Proteobacteria bacterium]|nr:hypothetical protein [Pseudomonadota bacterium]